MNASKKNRWASRLSVVVFLLLLSLRPGDAAAARCATDYTFTLIADSQVDLGGDLALELDPLSGYDIAEGIWPAVDVDGVVAFRSGLDSGGVGIFTGDGNDLKTFVLTQDADPASDFLMIPWPPTIATVNNSWHGVAFYGIKQIDSIPTDGIFRARFGYPTNTIAAPILAQEPDIRSNGYVLFTTYQGGTKTMVASNGSTTNYLFDSDTISIYFDDAVVNDSDVAFLGTPLPYGVANGIYRYRAGAVREHWAPDENFGPREPAISNVSHSGPGGFIVAMIDDWGDGSRLLTRFGESSGAYRVLVDSDVEEMDLSVVASVDGNGCAVFRGEKTTPFVEGIFVADENGMSSVIEVGDPLFGAYVWQLQMYKHAVNTRGQIAFWAKIGADHRVIVRADPVSFPCLTDLDEDGDTDGTDLAVFAASFGTTLDDMGYNEDADFDDSGTIDQNDLSWLSSQFGNPGCIF